MDFPQIMIFGFFETSERKQKAEATEENMEA